MAGEIKLNEVQVIRFGRDGVRFRGSRGVIETILAERCGHCLAKDTYDRTGMMGGGRVECVCRAKIGFRRNCDDLQ